jgi:NAD+ kinase
LKFGIVGKVIREKDTQIVIRLFEWMEKEGITFLVENSLIEKIGNGKFSDKGIDSLELVKKSDMILVLGGDGGILSTAKIVGKEMVPILGVNTGKLGFLAEIDINELIDNIKILLEKKFHIEKRMILVATTTPDNSNKKIYGLNDIVINKGSYSRTIILEIFIENKYFNTYTADGVIIATPTGSTAYSLSAGGPILSPDLDGIIINPICPHSLAERPVVISANSAISIKLKSDIDHVDIFSDGQIGFNLKLGQILEVRKGDYTVNLVHCSKKSFYDILRTKLNWGRRGIET